MGNCLKGSTSDDISLIRESEGSRDVVLESSPPPYQETVPTYYSSSNSNCPVTHLSEEEQIKIAKRIGFIQHLPTGLYDGCKKNRECVICMIEFSVGDSVRYLPCMHIYHVVCIDDWLKRSFTCPSCLEPVDAALLSSYLTN